MIYNNRIVIYFKKLPWKKLKEIEIYHSILLYYMHKLRKGISCIYGEF